MVYKNLSKHLALRILFLSYYFRPDLSAGSFRSSALVQELVSQPNSEVDVFTTKPNRYASFSIS